MTDKKADIMINISGGNIQILPNATHAEQHFYGCHPMELGQESVQETGMPDISSRLAIYISNVETRRRYVAQLRACQSAAEVGKTVVSMVQEVQGLTIDQAKTASFITIILNLATSVRSGITVPNFRKAIENAWYDRKE